MKYLALLLFFLAPVAHAAIGFDAASVMNHGVTTLSWTHTPVGTPTLAVVAGYLNVNSLSGITYGGQSMTAVGTRPQTGTGGVYIVMYYLVNPPSGAQSVVASGLDGVNHTYLQSYTYTGTALDASAIGNSKSDFSGTNSNSFDSTMTVGGSKSWVLAEHQGSSASASSLTGGGATFAVRQNGATNIPLYDSNGIVASGSDTFTYGFSANQTAGYGTTMLEIKPPSASFQLWPFSLF